jgi:alcohol dehydrogenase class IV
MWFFQIPKIIFGQDAVAGIIEELEYAKRIFIVTDQVIQNIGLLENLTSHIQNKEHYIFNDVEPEPSFKTVLDGGQACLRFQPDWIIALGGGSVIDAAKGIWFNYEKPELDIESGLNPFDSLEFREKARARACSLWRLSENNGTIIYLHNPLFLKLQQCETSENRQNET